MLFSSYRRLPQGDSYHDEKRSVRSFQEPSISYYTWKIICAILSVVLAASMSANVLYFHDRYIRPQALYNNIPSQYAGLRHNTLRRIDPEAKYFSLNRTIQDNVWNDQRLNSWSLFVALNEDYVVSQGLPHAMRWPWDLDKGVYILAAGHQMHCVHVLRSWINDKQDGKKDEDMEQDYSHALHCLNTLRETIMCYADDVPLYTGRVNENVNYKMTLGGRGMTRMCRNWDALKEWANERSACYLSTTVRNTSLAEIDKYKYCPDGSRPWEKRTDLY